MCPGLIKWITVRTEELRVLRLALVDKRCSHTKSWFSKWRWGEHVLAPAGLYVGFQHSDSGTSNTQVALASWSPSRHQASVSGKVSAKWQHLFFSVKHDRDEKNRNPHPPPEGHLQQRDSSHAHLETTSETSELARGEVCATPSLAQHIRNSEVLGSFWPPAQHLSSQLTCGFLRWEKALKPLLLVMLSREIGPPGTGSYPL